MFALGAEVSSDASEPFLTVTKTKQSYCHTNMTNIYIQFKYVLHKDLFKTRPVTPESPTSQH